MTEDGQPGYITTGEDGADAVVPFKAGGSVEDIFYTTGYKSSSSSQSLSQQLEVPAGMTECFLETFYSNTRDSGTSVSVDGAAIPWDDGQSHRVCRLYNLTNESVIVIRGQRQNTSVVVTVSWVAIWY